ncbi:hypothetical protein D9M73_117920 [compost metagenome]
MARVGGDLEPAFGVANLHRQQHTAKRLAPLQVFGKLTQPCRDISGFPAWPGEHLQQRLAVDRDRVEPDRMRKARGCADHAATGIGFPQPVRAMVFRFAQQQADGLVALRQRNFAGADQHQRARAAEAADHQQRGKQQHRRGKDRAADKEQHRGNRRTQNAKKAERRQRQRGHRGGGRGHQQREHDPQPKRRPGIGPHAERERRHRPHRCQRHAFQHSIAHGAQTRRIAGPLARRKPPEGDRHRNSGHDRRPARQRP